MNYKEKFVLWVRITSLLLLITFLPVTSGWTTDITDTLTSSFDTFKSDSISAMKSTAGKIVGTFAGPEAGNTIKTGTWSKAFTTPQGAITAGKIMLGTAEGFKAKMVNTASSTLGLPNVIDPNIGKRFATGNYSQFFQGVWSNLKQTGESIIFPDRAQRRIADKIVAESYKDSVGRQSRVLERLGRAFEYASDYDNYSKMDKSNWSKESIEEFESGGRIKNAVEEYTHQRAVTKAVNDVINNYDAYSKADKNNWDNESLQIYQIASEIVNNSRQGITSGCVSGVCYQIEPVNITNYQTR